MCCGRQSAMCQVSGWPPSTWRWRCGTEFKASGPTLKMRRYPRSGEAMPAASATARAAMSMSATTGPSSAPIDGRVVDVAPRHHQHVHGRGRIDVLEGHRRLRLVHDIGGHVAGDDAAEQAIGHRGRTGSVARHGLSGRGAEVSRPRNYRAGARPRDPDPAGATVPVRSDAIRAPAVTAAVSARSTLSPKPTVGRPEASSSLLHPPSGPTATT